MGRPLTLMGADRQMVISGIFIGLAAWLNLHTLWAGGASWPASCGWDG